MASTIKSSARNAGGFTLMELLAVIAIVLVLAALAFPVFSGIQARSDQSKCVANLRSSAQAVLLYTAEKGVYPRAFDGSGSRAWCLLPELAQYAGGIPDMVKVAICPAARVPITGPFPGVNNVGGVTGYPYVVNYNVMVIGSVNPSGDPMREQVRVPAIATPSKRVLMFDGAAGPTYGFGLHSTSLGNGWGRINARHFGKANIAWCDGHVSSQDPNSSDPSEKITDALLGFGQ